MPALSYKERFVEPVLLGLQGDPAGKTQSIRNFRKRPIKVGDTIYHFFAQRSALCKRLGESVCKEVFIIHIVKNKIVIYPNIDFTPHINHEGVSRVSVIQHLRKLKPLFVYESLDELDRFAKRDGFNDLEDMKQFWIQQHGKKGSPFPYTGSLYKW